MSFASPHLLYLLLVLPLLAGLRLWAGVRAGRVIHHWTSPRLREQLVSGVSRWRTQTIFALQLLALGCLVCALAQPRWGEDKVEQFDSGRNVIIAVDTSRSMLANDLQPNRMARVRLAAQDILAELPTDRVGLIAFAGNAYLQAPLTTDHEAMVEAIQSLDFTSVPRGGSEISRALKLAMETFEKNPARNHGLILFSDGGEPDAEVKKVAEAAAKKNVLVITVGVGTDAGSLIPDPDPVRPGDFIRDEAGNVVRTRLESGVLQQIASATRGRYLKLGTQAISTSVVKSVLASLEAQRNASKELSKPIERFQWPLALGVLLLMIAWFIRPARSARPFVSPAALPATPAAGSLPLLVACGFLFAVGNPPVAMAAGSGSEPAPTPSWLGAMLNPRAVIQSEAEEAQKAGNHKEAVELLDQLLAQNPTPALRYRYAQALGYSAHKTASYDRAVEAFSQALESDELSLQEQAHNGLAHTLYDQGDRQVAKLPKVAVKNWKDSIRHFDSALKLDPGNQELTENRDFVKSRLKVLEQEIAEQEQQEKGKGQKKKGQKGQKGEKGEEGEGEEGEEGENGDQDLRRKESRAQKEEGEEEGKGKEELPEGDIQAMKPEKNGTEEGQDKPGEEGQEKPGEETGQADQADERTGYTPNEARALLRNYADEHKQARDLRPRREPAKGKDW